MNVTDIVIAVIGCYFLVRGLFRGITGEIISLAAIVGGFYCALRFYPPLADFLSRSVGVSQLFTTAISMIAIFFAVFFCCSILDKLLKKFVKTASLTWVDKLLGGVAGLLKLYVVTLLVLVAGMIVSPLTGDAWVRESKVLIMTARTWPVVYPALDGLGVLPDLEKLQREAADYISKQAMGRLFEPDSGSEGKMSAAAGHISGDVPLSPDYQGSPNFDVAGSVPPADDLPTSRRNQMLDFFLGWGKERTEQRTTPATEPERIDADAPSPQGTTVEEAPAVDSPFRIDSDEN